MQDDNTEASKMVTQRTRNSRVTNKTEKVLEHLQKYGSITSLEAIELYGATRLSSIIYNLRKNYNIDGIDSQCTDRYGNTARYTKYVLYS